MHRNPALVTIIGKVLLGIGQMFDGLPAFLVYIGISPPDLFAGFCGGIVHTTYFGTRPGKLLLTVLANALTANYLGITVGTYFGATSGHVGAFITGVFALAILKTALKRIKPDFFEDGSVKDVPK